MAKDRTPIRPHSVGLNELYGNMLKLTLAGKWEHASTTFVATEGVASFEIGVVACNYESESSTSHTYSVRWALTIL